MRLRKLLSAITVKCLGGPPDLMDPEIRSIEHDSRSVKHGSLFCAIQGAVTDGHLYLDDCLKRGAAAVASEHPTPADFPVPWIQVERIRPVLAQLANHHCHHPSQQLRMVGVTGTNGKTTTALLIHSILQQHGPAMVMGTIKTQLGSRILPSQLTTPEAADIQRTLTEAVALGCSSGAMEISSHALALHRVYRCHFPVAVFTNLSQDHLDFHGSFDNYFQAKTLLFQKDYNPGLEHAVVNSDDAFGSRIRLSSETHRVGFGFSPENPVYPRAHKTTLQGTEVDLHFFDRRLDLSSPLPGKHNVYNIMAAAAASSLLGIPDAQIRDGISSLEQIPGRFERVEVDRPFTAIVDYAHTPHALENTLRLCRELTGARILCIFGCGGDRDRGKRPLMGAIAARQADYVIITSDNPRSEDGDKIAEEIRAGIPSGSRDYEMIVDRRQAISRAFELARKDDIVLVAGKGHEDYQEVHGKRIHFDDREVIRETS